MGTHQFRQLPVFIGSIHLLNNHVLLPDKFGWSNAKMFLELAGEMLGIVETDEHTIHIVVVERMATVLQLVVVDD